ncbi:MAG: hypothetical protein LBB76_05915 [Azoarcus sp.]|jgi:hypothetical protein|nr:hypothetical protein [Azoarcus sp.]
MQDTERETYMTLKKWVLEIYFDFCRTHAVLSGWHHGAVLGAVGYHFDCASNPVEQIMTDVVCLGLEANWYPDTGKNARSIIQSRIDTYGGWEALLSDITEEEAKLLRHDLKSLKLIA